MDVKSFRVTESERFWSYCCLNLGYFQAINHQNVKCACLSTIIIYLFKLNIKVLWEQSKIKTCYYYFLFEFDYIFTNYLKYLISCHIRLIFSQFFFLRNFNWFSVVLNNSYLLNPGFLIVNRSLENCTSLFSG